MARVRGSPAGARGAARAALLDAGEASPRASEALAQFSTRRRRREAPADSDEFAVYPTREALAQKRDMRDRRRRLGLDMYRLLGITKGDTDGILAALKRNYTFFDAPVGIIITVDKAGDRNFFGHVGSFLQTFCLLACERDLATCLQEAWSQFDEPVAGSRHRPRARGDLVRHRRRLRGPVEAGQPTPTAVAPHRAQSSPRFSTPRAGGESYNAGTHPTFIGPSEIARTAPRDRTPAALSTSCTRRSMPDG